jgi:hypothetical protein
LNAAASVAPLLSAHDLSVLIDFLLFCTTLGCVAFFHRHALTACRGCYSPDDSNRAA